MQRVLGARANYTNNTRAPCERDDGMELTRGASLRQETFWKLAQGMDRWMDGPGAARVIILKFGDFNQEYTHSLIYTPRRRNL